MSSFAHKIQESHLRAELKIDSLIHKRDIILYFTILYVRIKQK